MAYYILSVFKIQWQQVPFCDHTVINRRRPKAIEVFSAQRRVQNCLPNNCPVQSFLDAKAQLNKGPCLSVRPSICPWSKLNFFLFGPYLTAYDSFWQLITTILQLMTALKFMTVYDSFWQLMTSYDMTAFESLQHLWLVLTSCYCFGQLMTALNSFWQLLTAFDSLLQLMSAFDRIWQLMRAYESLWQLLTCYENMGCLKLWYTLEQNAIWVSMDYESKYIFVPGFIN